MGIGTSAPFQKLDVVGNGNFTGSILVNATSCDSLDTTASGMIVCGSDAVGSSGGSGWSTAVGFVYNDTTEIKIGIGMSAPGQKLDVAGGSIRTDSQLISTIATGTAPLSVSSTTKVANLNADLFDDQDSSFYLNAGNLNAGTLLPARLPNLNQTLVTIDATNITSGTIIPARLPNLNQTLVTGECYFWDDNTCTASGSQSDAGHD
ncbi:MAG: hypothetical protein HYX24_04025 [Candidatus Aenigmarchaeota archaeon]|nr:hypothetical protein [Candidatus Aenigmarchaeota archaeon]